MLSLELPTKLYEVTIPSIFTYSQEELEIYGLPMTVVNNETLQRDFTTSYSHVCLPLKRIIEIFNMGASIKLRNPDDLVEIYNSLEKYLNDTHDMLNNTIHKPKFQEDELQDIDRFLSSMFELNKHKITLSSLKFESAYSLGLESPMSYKTNEIRNTEDIEIVPRYGGKYDGSPAISVNSLQNNRGTLQNYPNSGGVTTINYIQNNAPEINFDKIKRRSMYKIYKKE